MSFNLIFPKATFFLFFLFTSIQTNSDSSSSIQNGHQFLLNPTKIDALFRRAALLALMKAKARITLAQVPKIERILFAECLAENRQGGKTPIHYAKCLAKMFRARDRGEQRTEILVSIKGKRIKMAKDADSTLIGGRRHQHRWHRRIRHFFNLWRRRKIVKNTVARKRRKRETMKTRMMELSENIRNMQKLEKYSRALVKCQKFIAKMDDRNVKLISKIMATTNSATNLRIKRLDGPKELAEMQHKIEDIFDKISSNQFSLLSPRLFSIFPSRRKGFLSPDLLSFHNSSKSSFSLPSILSLASIGRSEQIAWLDLLMNLTGTGRNLARLVSELGPKMERLEGEVLPAIRRIEAAERDWTRLKATLDIGQRKMLKTRGYAHLREWQQEIVLPKSRSWQINDGEDLEMAERRLEAKIAELAKLGEEGVEMAGESLAEGKSFTQELRKRRRKRQEIGGIAPDTESGLRPIPNILDLEPFAFDTRLGGVILEGLFLSPHAFYRELISPEILTIHVLSPVAFYATILSPMALFAQILSPEAFKLQVLTPQFLNTYTLSPEAFMIEVLSPIAAEARVLAPRTLFVQVLGPTAGAIHIGSPDTHGVLVLSPHILSPRIYSEERYLIEVLSPHILGGEHSSEVEEDEHEHFGGTVRFVGWPGHSPLGESEEAGGGRHHHSHGEAGHVHEGAETETGHVHEGGETETGHVHEGGETEAGHVHEGRETETGHVHEGGETETGHAHEGGETETGHVHEGGETETGHVHEGGETEAGHVHEGGETETGHVHEGGETETGHVHEGGETEAGHVHEGGETEAGHVHEGETGRDVKYLI